MVKNHMKTGRSFYRMLCLVLIVLASLVVNAQQKMEVSDSLLVELKKAKNDTNQAKILNQLCSVLSRSNTKVAIEYGRQGLGLSEKLKFETGIGQAKNSLSRCYFQISEYEKAIELAKSALTYFKRTNNTEGLYTSYANIADAMDHLGNYADALSNYFESYKIKERSGLNEMLAPTAGNIGNVYYHLGNSKDALKWYELALSYCIKYKNESVAANTYSNLGLIHFERKDFDKAAAYYLKAIQMHIKIGPSHDLALEIGYGNLAEVYESKQSFDSAIHYYNLSLSMSRGLEDLEGISFCHLHLGSIFLHQGKLKKAKTYLDSSILYSKQIGSKIQLRDGYYYLFRLDSMEGNYKKSVGNILQYIQFKDSLHNSEVTQQALKTSMKYEFSKKEDSLRHISEKKEYLNKEEVKRQKTFRNFSLLIALGLSFFLFMLFKQRNRIKKEKERSEELLLNILPAEISDELKERGESTARHYEDVTVLFTDFVEFTKIGEKLSPQVLVQELHECFSAFDKIIEQNGLEKIKTVGDAYIAVCGLPVASERHAYHCVKAAMEIREFMYNRKKQEKVFEIRIGIHSGPVVAGIVGVKKFAYDIWGDTVNTAARMEQNSEPGKINISETTYALVMNQISCTHRGKISAKGKGEIDMYFVNA